MAAPEGPVHEEGSATGVAAFAVRDQQKEFAVIGVFQLERNGCKTCRTGNRSRCFQLGSLPVHIAVKGAGAAFPPPVPREPEYLVLKSSSCRGLSFGIDRYNFERYFFVGFVVFFLYVDTHIVRIGRKADRIGHHAGVSAWFGNLADKIGLEHSVSIFCLRHILLHGGLPQAVQLERNLGERLRRVSF